MKKYITFLFTILLAIGCSPEDAEKKNNNSYNNQISASQKANPVKLIFKTLKKSSLPLKINFSELTNNCIPFDKSLLIKNNIKVYDPGSFTADYIDSKDLFATAEVYACSFFPLSSKYNALITKVEDQTTAMSNNIYLIIIDENATPVEGIAISYEITTPTVKQYINSTILPDLSIKITEKNIDINEENSKPQIINYIWKIDTTLGEIKNYEKSS